MENCLVTKLKGVVENNNLNYYGGIKLTVPSSGSVYSFAGGNIKVVNGSVDILDSNNNVIASNVTSYENVLTNSKIRTRNDNISVFHINKYKNTMYFGFITTDVVVLDLDTLNYSSLYSFVGNNKMQCNGILDLDTLSFTNDLVTLKFYNFQLGSKIIVNNPLPNVMRVFLANDASIKANIESILSNAINLTEVSLQNNAEITGNLNTLFDTLASAGKTGHLTCWLSRTNCQIDTAKGTNYKTLTAEDAFQNGYGIFVTFENNDWTCVQANSAPWN